MCSTIQEVCRLIDSRDPVSESTLPPRFGTIRRRISPRVKEREVLRVVATLRNRDPNDAFRRAQQEVLSWVRNRAGGELPQEAWEGETFDLLAGRTSGPWSTLRNGIWHSLGSSSGRSRQGIAGRVWTTEVTIGRPTTGPHTFGLRLIASSSEQDLAITHMFLGCYGKCP